MSTAAVLFDLDDTLFDHRASTRAALGALQSRYDAFGRWPFADLETAHARLLEELHVEVLAGHLTVDRARVRRFALLFEQAGHSVSDDGAAEAAAAYREVYLATWRPVDHALELLRALHGRVAVGVVTNNVAAEQHQKIEACGFSPYLDAVLISEEAGVAKPDPRIFRLALERLGSAPGHGVMVGDTWPTDIAGARGAGLRAIWFNRLGSVSPDPTVPEVCSLEPHPDLLRLLGVPA